MHGSSKPRHPKSSVSWKICLFLRLPPIINSSLRRIVGNVDARYRLWKFRYGLKRNMRWPVLWPDAPMPSAGLKPPLRIDFCVHTVQHDPGNILIGRAPATNLSCAAIKRSVRSVLNRSDSI